MRKVWICFALGAFILVWLTVRLKLIERFFFDYSNLLVQYPKVVLNPTPFIRRILPNPRYAPSKKIRVFNAYEPITEPPAKETFNVLVDAEPHHHNLNYSYDLIITTKQDVATHRSEAIYVPAWSAILVESERWSIPDLIRPRRPQAKSKFCAFMYSNCNTDMPGVKLREDLFRSLHARKRVDALGKCNQNVQVPKQPQGYWIDVAIDTYRPYKFVLACENMLDVPGYISEKIVLAFLAGCVPIYSGNASIREHFNPKCFIDVADFSSIDDCVAHILTVDRQPEIYAEYFKAPICTTTQLRRHTGWYYGQSSFYARVFQNIPEMRRQPYVPLANRQYTLDASCPIKVINLDRSQDRWKTMMQRFKDHPHSAKLRYDRFPAVDGKETMEQYTSWIDPSWVEEARDIRGGVGYFRPGEVGIYLSVMELYTVLVNDSENDWYCVFEDDVILGQTLRPIEEYIRHAPVDWEMLYLGVLPQYCQPDKTEKTYPYVSLSPQCMPSNYAVVVRKRAAQYFLNFAFPIQRPIDEFHRDQFANVRAYLYDPVPITTIEDTALSTIQNKT